MIRELRQGIALRQPSTPEIDEHARRTLSMEVGQMLLEYMRYEHIPEATISVQRYTEYHPENPDGSLPDAIEWLEVTVTS